ncbi:MAG: CopG family transcriptional regulator [Verrucomicrobiota bacterium]
MVRTQIQLPDDMYRDLKSLAELREWTLAETIRRAAEQFLDRYPKADAVCKEWKLPEPMDLGWRGLTHEQVREAILEDQEARLPGDHTA